MAYTALCFEIVQHVAAANMTVSTVQVSYLLKCAGCMYVMHR